MAGDNEPKQTVTTGKTISYLQDSKAQIAASAAREAAKISVSEQALDTTSDVSSSDDRFGLPRFEENIFVVFGYGSILWKQEFEYTAEYETYIKGYRRVFYQGTTEHRGVPGKPGRVVTLLPDEDPDARVYGKAYQLPSDPAKIREILGKLDVREQGGYDRVQVRLYDSRPSSDGKEVELDMYTHPNYQLPASAEAAAAERQKKCCLPVLHRNRR